MAGRPAPPSIRNSSALMSEFNHPRRTTGVAKAESILVAGNRPRAVISSILKIGDDGARFPLTRKMACGCGRGPLDVQS